VTVDEMLGRLKRVRKSGTGWIASCPAHDDRSPSLSVNKGDKQEILIKCHAGCQVSEICAALSIRDSDLCSASSNGNHQNGEGNAEKSKESPSKLQFESSFQGTDEMVEAMQAAMARSPECLAYVESRGISVRIAGELKWGFVPSWPFRNDEGETVRKPGLAIPHYVNRKLTGIKLRTVDGTKLFSQMPGSSISGLYGLGLVDKTAEEVLILEGPEDCALAISHGCNAVAINSASIHSLTKSDVELLSRYKRIYAVGDHDIAGLKAMNEVAAQLPPERVIRIHPFGYKDIGDLWRADPGNFRDKLFGILRLARASRAHFELDDLLTESEIAAIANVERYAVDQLIPLNGITMIFSEEKGGKSQLSTYILKCAVNGTRVFGKYSTRKMPVIVLDLEASDADIAGYITNFSRVGPEQIRYLTRKTGVPPLDSPALLRLCERERPLILLESLTKFVSASGTGKDKSMFDPADMSRFFDLVLNLCAAGATVIITHHSTRGDAERYADSHQIGAAVARAYVLVSEDRPQLRRVRLEGKLARGAEPITENLIAFPLISEAGMFGLSADCDPSGPEIEKLLAFVKNQPGEACFKDTIKKRPGKRAAGNLELLDLAIKRGILIIREDRRVAFPNSGTPVDPVIPFPSQGTGGIGL
jgi:hypothetical protein